MEELKKIIEESKKYIFSQRYEAFERSISSMVRVYKELGLEVAKDVLHALKLLNDGDAKEANEFLANKTKSYDVDSHYIAPLIIFSKMVIYNTSKNGEKFYKAINLDGKDKVDKCDIECYKKLTDLNKKFRDGTASKEDINSRYL